MTLGDTILQTHRFFEYPACLVAPDVLQLSYNLKNFSVVLCERASEREYNI